MRVQRLSLTVLVTALVVAAGASHGADEIKPAVVPFRMLPSNHMVVEAKLNGEGPFRLIFDLGSPVTLLCGKAAEQAGAIKADTPRSFLFGARGEATLKTLEVGTLESHDLPVVVMDHPALKALRSPFGPSLDGIIGYTFFARYRTTIDYKAGEMTFTPVDFRVRDLMKELPAQLAAPKVAKTRVLAPAGLWGITLGEPTGGVASLGVPVKAVLAGSSAQAGGVKAGDTLTMLDGRWTTSVVDAFAAVAGVPPGRAVDVVVLRDGNTLTLSITPTDGL